MQKSLANQIKGVCQAFLQEIVPRTGVEPVISALKGRRPRPLDERGEVYSLCERCSPVDCTVLLASCQAKIKRQPRPRPRSRPAYQVVVPPCPRLNVRAGQLPRHIAQVSGLKSR